MSAEDTDACGTFHILVVDDYPRGAESQARWLRRIGHEVEIATDGMRLLNALNATVTDVIFLDIAMPQLDGYEVAAKFAVSPGAKNFPRCSHGSPAERRPPAQPKSWLRRIRCKAFRLKNQVSSQFTFGKNIAQLRQLVAARTSFYAVGHNALRKSGNALIGPFSSRHCPVGAAYRYQSKRYHNRGRVLGLLPLSETCS
jgi:hypothetical protein